MLLLVSNMLLAGLKGMMGWILYFVFQSFHLSTLEAVDFLDTFLSMNPDPR